jgi:hypothetical protein
MLMQLTLLLLTGLGCGAPPVEPCVEESYLYQPAFCLDHQLRGPARPYHPQPGDIYLATDQWKLSKLTHRTSLSGAPHHSGIVVALPDGRLFLLEGGPFHSWDGAGLLDLIPAMKHYGREDRIYIRQRAVPLTEEQSRRLTAFAMAVEGKPFAWQRMCLQGTPFKKKGPLTTPLCDYARAADFDPDQPGSGLRPNYFCSELVAEACVAARLLDPATTKPTSTFPRELFFGTSINPYLKHHLDMSEWCPPARWTWSPGNEPKVNYRPFWDNDTSR